MRLEPLVLYHPSKNGGMAVQFEFRIPVEYDDAGRAQKDSVKQGGCFITWAQQVPGSGTGGDARFDWKDGWTVKLGLSDLSTWLVSRERYRLRGMDVVSSKTPGLWERLHRSDSGGQTPTTVVIRYEFNADGGGSLGLSYSKEERRSLRLSDDEEYLVNRYLSMVTDSFLMVGKR